MTEDRMSKVKKEQTGRTNLPQTYRNATRTYLEITILLLFFPLPHVNQRFHFTSRRIRAFIVGI